MRRDGRRSGDSGRSWSRVRRMKGSLGVGNPHSRLIPITIPLSLTTTNHRKRMRPSPTQTEHPLLLRLKKILKWRFRLKILRVTPWKYPWEEGCSQNSEGDLLISRERRAIWWGWHSLYRFYAAAHWPTVLRHYSALLHLDRIVD